MTLTLDIAMLGPSGAGKTSLLASLYSQFPKVTGSTRLVLAAKDSTTSVELSRQRQQLEAIARELVVREKGLPGTKAFREHIFSLRDQGSSEGSYIDLRFSDYPGGWLTSNEGIPDELVTRLDETDVLLLAIDTPALMAEDGRWHHEYNHPQRIGDILKLWAQKPRRLLVLVPLKCEAWVEDEAAALELAAHVEVAYRDALAAVWAAPERPQIVISPVQTVGSLVFNRYEVANGIPMVKFQGRRPGLKYEPQWTAEPLRWIVRSALRRQQSSRSPFTQLTDFVFGEGHHLRVAIDRLGKLELGPSVVLDGP